ncbi:MAG: thioredoxin family protein [Cyanobacteria bacterium P01_H01_bin.15]
MTTPSSPWRNLILATVAIALGVALFIGLRTDQSANSLTAQAEKAIPLEVALTNGKPTLAEFYADWCTSCQAMAADLAALKTEFGDRVNFAMLNIDNNKWLPEVLRYEVDGIPHFVFFDPAGESVAEAIGQQTPTALTADIEALITGEELPYIYSRGQTSEFEMELKGSGTDPRSHSAQIQAEST